MRRSPHRPRRCPSAIGGDRNWDYRYAWPRDASIGIAAFLAAGKPQEARAFLAWLLHASRLARPRLPVLFTLDGRPGPREDKLDGWPGYAGSRPVRIGNGAAGQHQLDGYGWVVDAAWLLTDAGHRLYGETWRAPSPASPTRSPRRGPNPTPASGRSGPTPAHHVHSKLMAWLALDRAIRIADSRGDRRRRRVAAMGPGPRCARRGHPRPRVRPRPGHLHGCLRLDELDAAVLVLPVLEIEPAASQRVVGTVDAIRRRLGAGGPLLYRYPPGTDGLAGGEGAFLPCSFWLVQALARIGRATKPVTCSIELVVLGGPLGLFGEEMDPATGEHLGNYPQALTHAALVQAVLALDDMDPYWATSPSRSPA